MVSRKGRLVTKPITIELIFPVSLIFLVVWHQFAIGNVAQIFQDREPQWKLISIIFGRKKICAAFPIGEGRSSSPPSRASWMIDRSFAGAVPLPLEDGARPRGGEEGAGGRRGATCQSKEGRQKMMSHNPKMCDIRKNWLYSNRFRGQTTQDWFVVTKWWLCGENAYFYGDCHHLLFRWALSKGWTYAIGTCLKTKS